MALSNDIISKFVKMSTENNKVEKRETTLYGEVSRIDSVTGQVFVKLDGAVDIEDGVNKGTWTELPITDTVEVSVGNRVMALIKNHSAIITANLSTPSANKNTTNTLNQNVTNALNAADTANKNAQQAVDQVTELNILVAKKVDTEVFTARVAAIENLESDSILTDTIEAIEGNIKTLEAEDVTIKGTLTAHQAAIEERITTNEVAANYAKIADLNTTNGNVTNLTSDVAEINTLIFGSATGKVVQAEFANQVIAHIGTAQIKDAMIDTVSAAKLTALELLAGTIRSDKVTISSSDGRMQIADNTIQIKDANRVRVQIGKDGTGDYSINIYDADGNLMFSEGGITDKAITDAIIRNDMVANDANIHASKLDIDSLFEEINSDGTNVIKSTKITVDEQGQTLDAAFKKMATTESVDNLSKTVSSQGTQIQANADSIKNKVWQQDINTAKNEMTTQYSTLSQDVNGFKTTVSNTYTTKADFNNLSIGGRNIILNSSFNHDGANWSLNTGPMHSYAFNDDDFAGNKSFEWHVTGRTGYSWIGMSQHFPIDRFKDGGKFILSGWAYVFSDEEVTGGASIELKKINTSDVTSSCGAVNLVDEGNPKDEWFYFEKMYTLPVSDLKEYFVFPCIGINGHIKISQLKLEFGTKATDWTPAPEDMAASEDVAHAQTTADEATARITTAETLIRQLSDSISMLVTDGNGTSLMTQTDDGWVFSTADIQNTVNRISENLSTLTDDVGNVDNTVSILQQAVDDLGILGEYIQITTYEDEPCIELGELDSDFKLRITNTRMMFTEGSVVLAYFTNQSFHSKKVVVEEELQQGGFVWKARANGNLGLVWKGGNS